MLCVYYYVYSIIRAYNIMLGMREYKHSIKQVGKKGVCTPRGTPPLCTNRAKYNTRYRYRNRPEEPGLLVVRVDFVLIMLSYKEQ